jgi:hypothetical protein
VAVLRGSFLRVPYGEIISHLPTVHYRKDSVSSGAVHASIAINGTVLLSSFAGGQARLSLFHPQFLKMPTRGVGDLLRTHRVNSQLDQGMSLLLTSKQN